MWFLLQQQQAKLARSTREKSDPEAELQTSTEKGKSSPGLLTALFRVFYARGRVGKSHSVDTNSPRMRKQKLHNNRLRSATPIFLPILGPAAAARQRSIPIAAAASLAKKKRISQNIQVDVRLRFALHRARFHPGWLLANCVG